MDKRHLRYCRKCDKWVVGTKRSICVESEVPAEDRHLYTERVEPDTAEVLEFLVGAVGELASMVTDCLDVISSDEVTSLFQLHYARTGRQYDGPTVDGSLMRTKVAEIADLVGL